jgi:hypothetical protein
MQKVALGQDADDMLLPPSIDEGADHVEPLYETT